MQNLNAAPGRLYRVFSRKKPMEITSESSLTRCLSVFDLIGLGIGSSLGVGVYVLAGRVAKDTAGPAVIISFAIAALASIVAGLCYAEFAARVPRAGSAYAYSYVTMGEFIAFIIGWTLIQEYVLGTASVVRGLSTFVDGTLFNNAMRNTFEEVMTLNVSSLSKYPDFFSFGVTISFALAMAFGLKESSTANNLFTIVNLGVVLIVIIAGAFKVNFENWSLPPTLVNNVDEKPVPTSGGFMPYGIAGVMRGASKCFYGFIGFDGVASTSEEAKNPQKSIPIAIVASLTVVFLAYAGVSTVLTTVVPFDQLDRAAPFPHMFQKIDMDWIGHFVTVGAICACSASLFGAMYPLPRVIYAMASDGLIFKWAGNVHSRFQTPFVGTILAGILIALIAALYEVDHLVDMSSIGTLLAYSTVAACVLILRYGESQSFEKRNDLEIYSITSILKQLVNYKRLTYSTKLTSTIVTSLVIVYLGISTCLAILTTAFKDEIVRGDMTFLIAVATLSTLLILILIFIYLQPACDKELSFTVPLVPWIPGVSIVMNAFLVVELGKETWIQFGCWMAVGFCVYFFYGVWNSNLRNSQRSQKTQNGWKNEVTPHH